MKVILFCGGMGMRLKDYSEIIPKPLVTIGRIPILFHIMRYYSYFGINDFILCLGYKAEGIKKFILNPDEYLSHNCHVGVGSKNDILIKNDMADWNISLIDTGLHANIGQRLKAVEELVAGEEVFMANYSDVLTDLPLLDFLEFFEAQGSIAGFLGVRPYHTFHVVNIKNGGLVNDIQDARNANIWINGGYFIFRKEIFHFIKDGEELVKQPFQRLIGAKQLISYQYEGFWGCMDTFKDKQMLEELYTSGQAPWEIWKNASLLKHVHKY
jgi:glucose-1-phosphate cytidylyltransferase